MYLVYITWAKAGTGQVSGVVCKDLRLMFESWDEFSSPSRTSALDLPPAPRVLQGPIYAHLSHAISCCLFLLVSMLFHSSFWKATIHSSKPYSVLAYRETSLKFSHKRRELWELCLQPILALNAVFSKWILNISAIWTLTDLKSCR